MTSSVQLVSRPHCSPTLRSRDMYPGFSLVEREHAPHSPRCGEQGTWRGMLRSPWFLLNTLNPGDNITLQDSLQDIIQLLANLYNSIRPKPHPLGLPEPRPPASTISILGATYWFRFVLEKLWVCRCNLQVLCLVRAYTIINIHNANISSRYPSL